jgi:hypothetical protein
MADFPPAQYIDGYSATGDTISFTIAGYTGKKVVSVVVTGGGSYATPTASVGFSGGGSVNQATATASMGLNTLSVSSVGASSLLQTSEPEDVEIYIFNGDDEIQATPLFGLGAISPNVNMFFDKAITPTVTVSGLNGTYTDASVSIDSSSSLHVASLVKPSTGSGNYPQDATIPVQIVNASNTNTVLGTATITTDFEGSIDTETVILDSWNTAESKSTLNGYSLKLKMTQPYFLVTGYGINPSNRTVYFRTDGPTPSVSIGATSPYGSTASFTVSTNTVSPVTFYEQSTGNIYVANVNKQIKIQSTGVVVATLSAGASECVWVGGSMTLATARSGVLYCAVDTGTSNNEVYIYISTVATNGGTAITYNSGGKYATNITQASATNIYSNPAGTTSVNGSLDVFCSSVTEISTSSFAIKALKMPISTSSSRISVTTTGAGYAVAVNVGNTGLYQDPELVSPVEIYNYDRMMILNSVILPNSALTYTSTPSINISGGGITNSNVVKTLTYKVNSVAVTDGGSGYATSPTVAFSGSVTSGGANATGTSALSATSAISLPSLTEAQADPTTGDFREVCHAICQLVNNIDTLSLTPSLQTTLQTGGAGIIDKFTFTFDLVPEAGVLTVDPEP